MNAEALCIHDATAAILKLLLPRGNFLDVQGVRSIAPLHPAHASKISAFLSAGEKIQIVLPAFPAKSPNREKTFGLEADYAEILALQHLEHLCESIRETHAPGAEVIVCSDGRVFSDLVLVSDEDVTAYRKSLENIIEEFSFNSIRLFNLENVFPNLAFDEMREALVCGHAMPITQVRAEVQSSPAEAFLFNGIHRFVFEDRLPLFPDRSRNKIREDAKPVAYEVIQRSHAWSSLVGKMFPKALRLSIHPQLPGSEKLGYRLVHSAEQWRTPWHSVALLTSEGFRLVKRVEAEALGAELCHHAGKYPFYQTRSL